MKSRDFCYWLQGYVELTNPDEIEFETLVLIKRHLAMVFIHEGPRASGFCHWLQGALHDMPDHVPETNQGESWSFSSLAAAPIRERLSAEFLHVIDPTFPVKQQIPLTAAHGSGGGADPGSLLMNC